MAIGPDRRYMTAAQADAAQIDVGLRQYMLRVYQYMAGGLALTGAVALYVANSPAALNAIFGTPLAWVVMLAPLGFALMFGFRIHKMTAGTAQMLFWAFAAVMGLSLSLIFVRFTGESIRSNLRSPYHHCWRCCCCCCCCCLRCCCSRMPA